MEEIVPEIDEELRIAGFTYENILKVFEDDGSSQWCERVYNKDAEYKYIGPYRNGTNYLGSLQGARTTHRRWWLSHRFDYYDAKFFNGAYKGKQFIVNFISPPAGKNMLRIVAGADSFYGTFADGLFSNRSELKENEEAYFNVQENVQLGRNIGVLGGHNIYELDLRIPSAYVGKVDLTNGYDSILGSKMRRLIMGSDNSDVNNNLTNDNFKGLSALVNLEEVNIQRYKSITALEGLDSLKYLKVFNASESGLATVSFAKGAPLEKIFLPATIQTLVLSELPLLTSDGITFDTTGYDNVTSITIDNCAQLLNS